MKSNAAVEKRTGFGAAVIGAIAVICCAGVPLLIGVIGAAGVAGFASLALGGAVLLAGCLALLVFVRRKDRC